MFSKPKGKMWTPARYRIPRPLAALILCSFFFMASCGGGGDKNGKSEFEKRMSEADSARDSRVVNVSGKLFSIPSPIQTAYLIERSGADFDEGMVNDPERAANYTTKFEKAINLGIYGADLGYVTIYDNTQNALSYLNSIRSLADDIGVGSAFDKSLIERFSENLDNEDSLLALVSDAYKAGDAYLKKNERNDVAGSILAGGWIEALYFASHVAKNGDDKVKERVAMQRTSLNNLIQLLGQHRNREEVNDLVEDLEGLFGVFESISIEYEYREPETYPEERMTVLKSRTKVDISDEQLNEIHERISKIREQIIDR